MPWIYLLIAIIAMWYPTPTRDSLVGVIWLAPIVLLLMARRRPSVSLRPTASLLWGAAFIGLCIVNMSISLYPSRGMILLYRPLSGLFIVTAFMLSAHRDSALSTIRRMTIALTIIIGVAVTTATQWSGKSAEFLEFIRILPQWQGFDLWIGGFNANEIAGALTWLLPLGVVMLRAETGWWRWLGLTGVMLSAVGLVLGQSLSGLMGGLVGLLIALLPGRWWPRLAGMLLMGVVIVNLAVLLLPIQSAEVLASISGRPDISSLNHRGVIWERAGKMLSDAPWTGVGIAMYRQLRAEYPTPGYEHALLPHPHNEMLQFAADFGWPGTLLWLALYLSTIPALWRAAQSDQRMIRLMAQAAAAGLLGHAVYGLTDAIPVWDRFAFILWWLLGWVAALQVRTSAPPAEAQAADTPAPG